MKIGSILYSPIADLEWKLSTLRGQNIQMETEVRERQQAITDNNKKIDGYLQALDLLKGRSNEI